MPSDNPSKGKFEENICSYRYSFKSSALHPASSYWIPSFKKLLLSLLYFCTVILWCCVLIVWAWLYQRLLWNVTIICMSEETRRTQRRTPLGGREEGSECVSDAVCWQGAHCHRLVKFHLDKKSTFHKISEINISHLSVCHGSFISMHVPFNVCQVKIVEVEMIS